MDKAVKTNIYGMPLHRRANAASCDDTTATSETTTAAAASPWYAERQAEYMRSVKVDEGQYVSFIAACNRKGF